INTIITGFPWPTVELWLIYSTIIVVQTLAVGYGAVAGEKLAELSEQRRRAVAELEAALEENAALHAQLLAQARAAGVLDERGRVAGETHDTPARGLSGVATQREAGAGARGRPADGRRPLDSGARRAGEGLSEARRSVQASLPEPLEGARLPDAL